MDIARGVMAQELPLPNRVRELREANGWSLVRFSQECGLSPAYIQKIEVGTRGLRDHHARMIARAFDIPLTDLFLTEEGGLSAEERETVEEFRSLDPSLQQAVRDFIHTMRGQHDTETPPDLDTDET